MPSKKKITKKKSTRSSAKPMTVARPAKKSMMSMNVLGGTVIILLGITVVLLMITYFSTNP